MVKECQTTLASGVMKGDGEDWRVISAVQELQELSELSEKLQVSVVVPN